MIYEPLLMKPSNLTPRPIPRSPNQYTRLTLTILRPIPCGPGQYTRLTLTILRPIPCSPGQYTRLTLTILRFLNR